MDDTAPVALRQFRLASSNEELKILLSCSHLDTLLGNKPVSDVEITK